MLRLDDFVADNPTPQIVEITPSVAHLLLSINTQNRKVKRNKVDLFARDMNNDSWDLNGEPIIVRKDMILGDGQHRLLACIKSNKPFKSVVVTGVDPAATVTLDTGSPRTKSDHFSIEGEKNAKDLATAARVLHMIATQDFRVSQTTREASRILEVHPKLRESVSLATAKTPLSTSVLGAIHYIGAIHQGEKKMAAEFVDVFKSGVPAYEGDPAQLYRERLIKMGKTPHIADRAEQGAYVWKLFNDGKALEQLRMPKKIPSKIDGWDEKALFGL